MDATQISERVIWLYWAQGLEGAPPLVRACVKSWQHHNPDWDVRLLDDENLHGFLDMSDISPKVNRTAYSDILRCRLLKKHGGVWADATVLCAAPLDDWLHMLTYSGFFAFSNPASDRPIASWFIAAAKGNYIIERLSSEVDAYWANGRREPSTYFWLHYTFLMLLVLDSRFRHLWQKCPRIHAYTPHMLQFLLTSTCDKLDISALRSSPVHKLTWKAEIRLEDLQEVLKLCGRNI
jgi:hypothetical protein